MGRLQEDFKGKVLDGYYQAHPQGEYLIEMDMEAIITEAVIEKEIEDAKKHEKENSTTPVTKNSKELK